MAVKHIRLLALLLILLITSSCTKENKTTEITYEKAIQIAHDFANKNNFNTQNADIEIFKVKKGIERGPIRLVWLVRQVPKDQWQIVVNNEFWVVYFYPKGQLERGDTLGGDYGVFVDLYSGKVIKSFAGL